MINLIVVDDNKLDGVSFWRNVEPFAALRKQYRGQISIRNETERVSVSDMKQADAVVMFRPIKPDSLRFVQNCKMLGIKVIIDIDDDIWTVPYYHPAYMQFERYKDTARQIYELADAVWTSTDQLRYVIGDLGKTEVMQNAVMPEWLPDNANPYTGVAAWIGSAGLQYDLSGASSDWFSRWQDKYRQWLFFGYRPEIASGANCAGVPYGFVYEFFQQITAAKPNVIWKPLRDLPFNHAKSNIAWLTATMSGGVCVTNFAGHDGWECALPGFTTDEDEIYEKFHHSRNVILQDYNLLEVNDRRMQSISQLVFSEKKVLA